MPQPRRRGRISTRCLRKLPIWEQIIRGPVESRQPNDVLYDILNARNIRNQRSYRGLLVDSLAPAFESPESVVRLAAGVPVRSIIGQRPKISDTSDPTKPTTTHSPRKTTVSIRAVTCGGVHNGAKSTPLIVIQPGEIETHGGISPSRRTITAVIKKPVLR